jgi:hypothetical protein
MHPSTETITSPANNAKVGFSILVAAHGVSASVIQKSIVYFDNTKVYSIAGGDVDTTIFVGKFGDHRITVQFLDASGWTVSSVNVSVVSDVQPVQVIGGPLPPRQLKMVR